MNAELITRSLDLVAARCEDPTALVYARLFAQSPEMEAMFVLDTDDSVKGHMLSEVIHCILDFVGPRTYAANLIPSELTNHDGLGVPPAVFATFFATVMETFREIAGDQWSADMDGAWQDLLAGLGDVIARHGEGVSA